MDAETVSSTEFEEATYRQAFVVRDDPYSRRRRRQFELVRTVAACGQVTGTIIILFRLFGVL